MDLAECLSWTDLATLPKPLSTAPTPLLLDAEGPLSPEPDPTHDLPTATADTAAATVTTALDWPGHHFPLHLYVLPMLQVRLPSHEVTM